MTAVLNHHHMAFPDHHMTSPDYHRKMPKSSTCNGCYLTLPLQEFPPARALLNCHHNYCWNCLTGHFLSTDFTHSPGFIPCPTSYCFAEFTPSNFLITITSRRRRVLCNTCNKDLPPSTAPGSNCSACLAQVISCTICFAEYPRNSFPSITEECNHDTNACHDCLQMYFSVQQQQRLSNFPCPIDGCGKTLSHNDIHRLAAPAVFERYDRALTRNALRDIPGIVFCAAPQCSWGDVPRCGANTLDCAMCGRITCVACEAIHDGVTCEQYRRGISAAQARDEESWMSTQWERENAKNCPGRGCGRIAWKETGCNHMECTVCKTIYCWHCLTTFTEWVGCH